MAFFKDFGRQKGRADQSLKRTHSGFEGRITRSAAMHTKAVFSATATAQNYADYGPVRRRQTVSLTDNRRRSAATESGQEQTRSRADKAVAAPSIASSA